MTRSEFREISEWDDLINFCEDNDLEACNEVCSVEEYDTEVCEEIKNYVCYHTFFGLVDKLYELPRDNYAVYIKRSEFKWEGSDDRDHLFYEFKEAAESEALEEGVFEEDEEDYEEPEEIFDDPEDDEPLPEEEFDVFKLTTDTAKLFQQLKEKETEEEKEASAKFASLLGF